MITIPCLNCGAAVPLPVDEGSPKCSKCGQVRQIRWFKPRGKYGTKTYQSAFDVWRMWTIAMGFVDSRRV